MTVASSASQGPRPRWWLRRLREGWHRWRRLKLQILWPVVLVMVALGSHMYLANRAVMRWHQIQRLRSQNWTLWWDIQDLRTHLEVRRRQAMEDFVKTRDWLWPQPQEVLYVTQEMAGASSDSWNTSGWVLPPFPEPGEMPGVPEAYMHSLVDWLHIWWQKHGRVWWQEGGP